MRRWHEAETGGLPGRKAALPIYRICCRWLLVGAGLAVNWSATATTIVLALNQKLRHQVGGSCADRAVHEVTLAASGRKAGANKKSAAWSSTKTRSSLCKVSMLDQAVHLHGLTQGRAGVAPPFRTYKEAKFEHLGRGKDALHTIPRTNIF